MDAEKAYPIAFMCTMLDVSRSAYYDWKDRPASAAARRRETLAAMITAIFEANHGTYGYRRVHAVLARSGVVVSPELVRQLMRELGLVPCQPRPWRPTTTEADPSHRIPDLLGRDFTAEAPGTKLVADITYIPTGEGWVYLATVIDCYSKMVVGWSMADHYRTPLIVAALESAAGTVDIQPDCVFHSDRGSNLHVLQLRHHTHRYGHAAIRRADRSVLGQCDGRIVLWRPEERMAQPYDFRHTGTGPTGGCQIHRRLL
jgi:transposase InsO family protein